MLILAKVSITSSVAAAGWRYSSTFVVILLCEDMCCARAVGSAATFTRPKKDNILFFEKVSMVITSRMKNHFACWSIARKDMGVQESTTDLSETDKTA